MSILKLAASLSGLEQKTVELLTRFYKFYGRRCRIHLFGLFIGAIFSGVIEIAGLILLYLLIRLLIQIKTVDSSNHIIYFFNSIGITEVKHIIPIFGGAILMIFVLKNIYLIFYYLYQHRVLRRWKFDISNHLMEQYLYAPYKFLLSYNSSTIIRNVTVTVSTAMSGFVLSSLSYGANLITAILIVSLLCIKHLEITVIVAGVLAISTIAQNKFLRAKQIALGKEKEHLSAEQTKSIFQGFHAVKETKISGKERYFSKVFENNNKNFIRNEMTALFYSRLPSHLTEIVIVLAVVIVTVTVLIEAADDPALSLSSLGILAAMAFRLAPIMNKLTSAMQTMNKSSYSMNLLFKEIDTLKRLKINATDSEIIPALPFEKSIELEGISYKYPTSDHFVLDGANLKINKGEIIGIIGSSGAGKTTIIDILLGLLPPSSGSLKIDGKDLDSEQIPSWQKNISYVPQKVYLSELSIAENVAFGVEKSKIDFQKVEEACRFSELTKYLSENSHGILEPVGENGKNLSGGQIQRIGIARALYSDRNLIILDESTSALDMQTEKSIIDRLLKLRGSRTIVFITHRIQSLSNMDRIFKVEDGQIVQVNPLEIPNLLSTSDLETEDLA